MGVCCSSSAKKIDSESQDGTAPNDIPIDNKNKAQSGDVAGESGPGKTQDVGGDDSQHIAMIRGGNAGIQCNNVDVSQSGKIQSSKILNIGMSTHLAIQMRSQKTTMDETRGTVDWIMAEHCYLADYPKSIGYNQYSCLEDAQKKALSVPDCGGITQTGENKYELRAYKRFQVSDIGETSWKKIIVNGGIGGGGGDEHHSSVGWKYHEGCYLAEYPPSIGPNQFDDLETAMKKAETIIDCGGITKVGNFFELRHFRKPHRSTQDSDECSWVAPAINHDIHDDEPSQKKHIEHDSVEGGGHGGEHISHESEEEEDDEILFQRRVQDVMTITERKKKDDLRRMTVMEKKRNRLTQHGGITPEEVYLKICYPNTRGYYKKDKSEVSNGRPVWKSSKDKDKWLFHSQKYQAWCVAFFGPKGLEYSSQNLIARTQQCPDSQSPLNHESDDWIHPNHVTTKVYSRDIWDNPNEAEEGKFTDPEFPPGESILGGPLVQRFGAKLDWVRACNLHRGEQMELFSVIEPNDIQQGSIGNCWLLAAMGAVAEYPGFIEDNIFVQTDLAPDSKYEFNLYCPCKGVWEVVTIDDWIPIDKTDGEPLFTRPVGNQIWVMLLEKAFAKLYGNYWGMKGGQSEYGFVRLVGPCDNGKSVHKYKLRDRETRNVSKGFRGIYLEHCLEDLEETPPHLDGKWYCYNESKDKDTDKLWNWMKKADDRNYLLGTSMWAHPGNAIEHKRTDGLIEAHEYTVISLHDIRGEDVPGGRLRLIKLRNPWGRYEWTGKFNDEDHESWSQLSDEILEKHGVKHINTNDGMFFMPWEDYVNAFTCIGCCPKNMGAKRVHY